jgi:hypothetical protein
MKIDNEKLARYFEKIKPIRQEPDPEKRIESLFQLLKKQSFLDPTRKYTKYLYLEEREKDWWRKFDIAVDSLNRADCDELIKKAPSKEAKKIGTLKYHKMIMDLVGPFGTAKDKAAVLEDIKKNNNKAITFILKMKLLEKLF